MESSGIIKSYTVITDEHKTGNDVTALMEISLEHPRYNELFIENIKKNPNIISCYYLTGEFDYLLKIACQSSEHLEQIHHWIKDQDGVRQTRTHYVLRTVKKYLFFPSGSNRTLISERNFYEKYEAYFRSCRGRDTDCPLSAHLSFFPLWTVNWRTDCSVLRSPVRSSSRLFLMPVFLSTGLATKTMMIKNKF